MRDNTTNNTSVVLLLLSIGLFYTFTNAQYQDVKNLSTLMGEYKDALQKVSDIVELRDVLLADYGTIPKTEIDRTNKILPDNVDTVRLALDLDGMASRYGISIKNIQATTETNQDAGLIVLPEYADPYDKAIVSFSFVANYENFMLLLADVERNLRIMDVKKILFQANDSGLYEYQVSVETYWLK